MKNSCLIYLLTGALSATVLFARPEEPMATEVRPNIIFLLADDLAVTAVGCYGNKEISTPNLDRLAAAGLRFTGHYDTTSICMASRCSLLTGLYEYRHGCNFLHGDLGPQFLAQSYPVQLRQAGYYTGFAGKVGFLLVDQKFDALEKHFDAWAGGPGQTFYATAENKGIAKYAAQYPQSSRAYGAWAVDFLKTAKKSGKPFCLSISFKAPHLPFQPDPADLKLYEGKKFSRAPNYGTKNAGHLSPQSKTSRAWLDFRFWMNDYDASIAKYYALVTGLDAAVGMICEGLEREGLASNTIIIFTSDNGYNCGAHGFGDKVLPYEEASKAPLIIYDPRQPKATHAGTITESLTANVDIAPTIFALAKVPAPAGLDGKNLVPMLENPKTQVREVLPLFNFWGEPASQSMAVVTQDWKYIYWYYGGANLKPTEELFHIGADRFELTLETNNQEKLAAMRQFYDAELAQIKEKVLPIHGYTPYSLLFDRHLPWSEKSALVAPLPKGSSEGDDATVGKNSKRKPAHK